jgi:uncharacterized membrane protein
MKKRKNIFISRFRRGLRSNDHTVMDKVCDFLKGDYRVGTKSVLVSAFMYVAMCVFLVFVMFFGSAFIYIIATMIWARTVMLSDIFYLFITIVCFFTTLICAVLAYDENAFKYKKVAVGISGVLIALMPHMFKLVFSSLFGQDIVEVFVNIMDLFV